MRTMVALVFAWNLAANLSAQVRPAANAPLELLESYAAAHPGDVPVRVALLQRYFNLPEGALPLPVAARRRNIILWMIAHHPDAPELARPIAVIDPGGRLADPEGSEQAAKLWWSRAAVPGAPPKVIANAIYFYRFHDRAAARDLLEFGWKSYPKDNDLARMRGMLDAMAFLGAAAADANGNVTAVDGTGVRSPAAAKARQEIESTRIAALAGGAGQFIEQQFGFLNREGVLGDEDPLELARAWLGHAHQLDPQNGAWIDGLMQTYLREATLSLDPHAQVQALSKALEIADTQPRQIRVLNARMEAEFNLGDAAAAEGDAEKLLDLVTVNANLGNFDEMIHSGETMLGRVALARGNLAEAKQHLAESAKVKLRTAPKITLAQGLLDAGERDAVIRYLEACRSFWQFDQGRIDHAEKLIRTEAKPDILSPWRPEGLALVRKKAPAFELADLSGKMWTLDGSRPVALLFFRIDCPACIRQLRVLDRAPNILAIDEGDEAERVRRFAEEGRFAMPFAIDTASLRRRYDADELPSLVVIDRHGEVAAYSVGEIAPDMLRAEIAQGAAGLPALAAPVPQNIESAGGHVTFSWRPVPGAESYVVEWDTGSQNGWVRVIPTRETKAELDCPQQSTGQWRVYAVSGREGSGPSSVWREFSCQ